MLDMGSIYKVSSQANGEREREKKREKERRPK